MRVFLLILVVGAVLALALVSAILEWLPSRADAAFLCVAGFSAMSYGVWLILSQFFDRTNGNDTSILANFIIWVVIGLALILAPVAVLLSVPWISAVLAAGSLILCVEIWAAWEMWR
ncbi:hypothetical protein KKF05_01490 [Patescibacteria group bacterium]|nr:hypothetical protein [Patescibacteria group bacterium]MBU1028975.1 hypothetical protein [Patescibacteria group bacterium]